MPLTILDLFPYLFLLRRYMVAGGLGATLFGTKHQWNPYYGQLDDDDKNKSDLLLNPTTQEGI